MECSRLKTFFCSFPGQVDKMAGSGHKCLNLKKKHFLVIDYKEMFFLVRYLLFSADARYPEPGEYLQYIRQNEIFDINAYPVGLLL